MLQKLSSWRMLLRQGPCFLSESAYFEIRSWGGAKKLRVRAFARKIRKRSSTSPEYIKAPLWASREEGTKTCPQLNKKVEIYIYVIYMLPVLLWNILTKGVFIHYAWQFCNFDFLDSFLSYTCYGYRVLCCLFIFGLPISIEKNALQILLAKLRGADRKYRASLYRLQKSQKSWYFRDPPCKSKLLLQLSKHF